MIVCSCNVLSDGDIRGCLHPGPGCPRTPAQVYNRLGCKAECGQCARTIRSIMKEGASVESCAATCCPLQENCALASVGENEIFDAPAAVGSLTAQQTLGAAG